MLKKTLPLILLLSSALFFTSCNDDDDDDAPVALSPVLSVSELTTGNADGGDFTITEGDELRFAVSAQDGSENMDEFLIVVTGANSTSSVPTSSEGNTFPLSLSGSDQELYQDTIVFLNAGTNLGVTNYTFSVTDVNGAVSTVSYDVTVEASDDLVLDSFTWERQGSNPATGLDQFGLMWDQNQEINGEFFAVVMDDEATVFVELTEDDWDNITSSPVLATAINDAFTAGASLAGEGYKEISAGDASRDYNDYLGVIYQGEPYILFIQSSTAMQNPVTLATDVTVTGFFKN